MPELERGTVVRVVDPEEEYVGLTGVVQRDFIGWLTGRTVVEVRLQGRPVWDTEGFWIEQLEEVA